MANHYEVPSWAGKAPTGHHLDVTKDDKLIQKLMIDEKKCYLFGRNAQLNDFCIDHASCSRIHAALVYHKHLNISYLVDLGSTHGTFIGTLQLEAHKPTQLPVNSTFHFGASTRYYVLRERPTGGSRSSNIMEDIPMNESMSDGTHMGLPESQNELDNLTEYNTAHNRRISMLGITDDNIKKNANKAKRKRRGVTFCEDDIVINPEDIDPAVGRFRNLIQSTVVPTKRLRLENTFGISSSPTGSSSITTTTDIIKHQLHPTSFMPNLYHDLPMPSSTATTTTTTNNSMDSKSNHQTSYSLNNDMEITSIGMSTKLGLILPNPAPDVAPLNEPPKSAPALFSVSPKGSAMRPDDQMDVDEPKKKKYAKEAWPGRKPLLSGL